MSKYTDNFCCGCLNTDMDLSVINNAHLKKCFNLISNGIKETKSDLLKIVLCYYCAATLRTIRRFQKKVHASQKLLKSDKNVLKVNHQYPLQITEIHSISLGHDCENVEIPVKSEPIDDIHSVYSHDSENTKDDELVDGSDTDKILNHGIDGDRINEDGANSGPQCETSNVTFIEKGHLEEHISDRHDNPPRKQKQSLQKTDVFNLSLTGNCKVLFEVMPPIKSEQDASYCSNDDSDRTELNNADLELKRTEWFRKIKLKQNEVEEERNVSMKSDDYLYAMFKCVKCIVTFTNNDDLVEHVSEKHNINSKYKCEICERSLNSILSYKYHLLRHYQRFQCTVCDQLFTTKRDVLGHIHSEHGIDSTLLSLENNESINNRAKYPCPVCSKVFSWKTSLSKHVQRHQIESGEKRKPYCEPCKIYFKSTFNLKKHVQGSSKHKIQLKLQHGINNKMESNELKKISKTVNESRKLFPCTHCDKKFQWKGNLLRHIQGHEAKLSGELRCAPCDRTFSSPATFRQHMKSSLKHVTEDDLKYVCGECGRRFASKCRLRDHIDYEHLKNYSNKCSRCDKVFKTRASLYLHNQVVHQKKEFLCDHCGKYYSSKTKLGHHVRAAHTRDLAYRCSTCDAKFSWHSCLSRHKRTHKHT